MDVSGLLYGVNMYRSYRVTASYSCYGNTDNLLVYVGRLCRARYDRIVGLDIFTNPVNCILSLFTLQLSM